MVTKRRRMAGLVMILIALTTLAGCDVFQIHRSGPGYEAGIITDAGDVGNNAGAGGTGVGVRSSAGPSSTGTGTSTQKLGTGYGGSITAPGPGRQGR